MRTLFPLFVAALLTGCPQPEDTDTPKNDTGPDTTDDTGDSTVPVDEDRDGYLSDVDCDDHDYQVYPEAPELCDGKDNDCDDAVDEDYDEDGDGHFSMDECDGGDDCNDADDETWLGAPEIPYDGLDQDCDGEDEEDVDDDGFRATEVGGNDCDDTDAEVNPRAEEVPFDGIDNDCRDGDSSDADGDGYNDVTYGGDDCDDTDPRINPGAWDWMNDALDHDCDGVDPLPMDLDDLEITIEGTSEFSDLVGHGIAVCDFDEDGLDDLVVGAPFGDSYAGQVGIWYGNGADLWTGGMAMDDADTLVTGDGYDFIGFAPRCGDVDGDGHEDLLMVRGEIDYYTYQTDFGILVFYGTGSAFAPLLLDRAADAELSLPLQVPEDEPVVYSTEVAVGDLDGDGAEDVVVDWLSTATWGAYSVLVLPGQRWSGTLSLDEEVAARITTSLDGSLANLAVLQDLDSDGLLDLALAEPYWSDTVDTGGGADTGDTGAWYSTEGQAAFLSNLEGLAGEYVSDVAWSLLRGTSAEMLFGWEIVAADLDGDGATDGAISFLGDATEAEMAGGLYVWSDLAGYLPSAGDDPMSEADAHTWGFVEDGYLGWVVRAAGDVDGDGCDDLLLSDPNGGSVSTVGSVWLASGALLAGEAPIDSVALMEFMGADADNYMGYDMLGGADFDGDGRPDLVMSALGWDDTDSADYNSGKVAVALSGRSW